MKIYVFLGILYLVNLNWAFVVDFDDLFSDQSYESIINELVGDVDSYERTKREDNKNDTKTVCYEGIGCFDSSGPFKSLNRLPDVPATDSTKFWFWPPVWHNHPEPIVVPFENMTKAMKWLDFGFDVRLPTKMLVHGFGSNCSMSWTKEYKIVLRRKQVNLLCLDWSRLTHLPHYIQSTVNGRVAAKQTAIFLEKLKKIMGLQLENVHLLGFSLGAHIAGYIGSYSKNLGRITGLDPSGPLFEDQHPAVRLDPTDALFVDVIHTNTENLLHGGFGTSAQMGHVDFYPNGGRFQTGCNGFFTGAAHDLMSFVQVGFRNLIPEILPHDGVEWVKSHIRMSREIKDDSKMQPYNMDYDAAGRPGEEHTCNHKRVNRYFIDSVDENCHYTAFSCNTYEDFLAGNCFPCTNGTCCDMGYYTDKAKCPSGRLFLKTRIEHPFCGSQYLIKLETKPSSVPIENYGKISITFIEAAYQNEEFVLSGDTDHHMIPVDQYILKQIVALSTAVIESVQVKISYEVPNKSLPYMALLEVERLSVMDAHGKVHSFCNLNVNVDQSQIFTLYPGQCTKNNHV